MSFFNNIKNIFGFGPDVDYTSDPETSDDPDIISSDEESVNSGTGSHETVEGLSDVPTLPEIDANVKARIFEGAVAVFNESLPEFLRKSVDPEKQAKQLAEALDKGLDDYLNSLMLAAEQYAEGKLKSAADAARRDAEKLRADMQMVEQQRSSLREQQLSADRRRRALADRVNDLETQLANVEAEREQFELENRSLLNKLKVADIQPGVVDDMAREIESLKARLASGDSDTQPAADNSEYIEKAATMEAERDAALKEAQDALAKASELSVALDESNAKIEELTHRAEKAEAELTDSRNNHELSETMFNDLQNSLVTERQAREEAEKSLAEAREIIASVEELQSQMMQVEDVIRKRDERIEKLKASNKKLRDQLNEARETVEQARRADTGLFAMPGDDDASATTANEAFAAMEDDFECPDWFVSRPEPGEVSPLLHSDCEFGYQEPPKKPRKPENDAQLSLF